MRKNAEYLMRDGAVEVQEGAVEWSKCVYKYYFNLLDFENNSHEQ